MEIPTGEGRFRPLQLLLPSSKRKSDDLGLTKQTCTGSVALRYWCERNKNRCYIPEWLLEEWGIAVDPYISGAA